MIRRAKQLHMEWMRFAAYLTLAITGIMFLPALANIYLTWELQPWKRITDRDCYIAFAGIGIFIGLLTWRQSLAKDFDPNSDPVEERIRRGQERAIGKDEFLWNQSNGIGRSIPPKSHRDERFTAERDRARLRSGAGLARRRRRRVKKSEDP